MEKTMVSRKRDRVWKSERKKREEEKKKPALITDSALEQHRPEQLFVLLKLAA